MTSHGYVGLCSCGFRTALRSADKNAVQIKTNDHRVEAIDETLTSKEKNASKPS